MSQTALKPTEIIEPEKHAPIELLDSDMLTIIGRFSPLQQKILIALCENAMSETTLSDREIAANLGTDRGYIWDLRKKPLFTKALGALIQVLAQGTQDAAFAQLRKHAKTSVKANEIWLRMGETFIPASKNLNTNVNLNTNITSGTTREDLIDTFISKLLDLGWSPSRIAERAEQIQQGE